MINPKKGGGKLSRTETVTVRLDPQLRYMLELASRQHRRTMSSYIEVALKEASKNVFLNNSSIPLSQEMERLWDVDEEIRFSQLASTHPYLLNFDEQVRWKKMYEESKK